SLRAYLRAKLLQPTTHAQRYAAMRQINGLSIVKPTAMSETKGPWVSMVLLGRFAVQFLQARVREGETFGHIHSSADDFDVCTGFTFARCFQSGIEFAQRLDARSEPIGASESVRQLCVTPFCQVVVGPIWIWLQRPLHHIAIVVETEDDGISTVPAHVSDLVSGQLVRTFSGDENCFPFWIGERYPEARSRGPPNGAPKHLDVHLHIIRKRQWRNSKARTSAFQHNVVPGSNKLRVARIEGVHRDL